MVEPRSTGGEPSGRDTGYVEDDPGSRFYLWMVGGAIAVAGAIFLGLMLLFGALNRWGFFGCLIVLAVVSLAGGWFYDRHQRRSM